MARFFHFDDSGSAYDATQCDEDIKNGDGLVCFADRVIGLADTWPVAITVEAGKLHSAKDSGYFHRFPLAQVQAVVMAAHAAGWAVDPLVAENLDARLGEAMELTRSVAKADARRRRRALRKEKVAQAKRLEDMGKPGVHEVSFHGKVTIGDAGLFVAFWNDAGNWSGNPLVGGNVGGTQEDNAHLTNLKKAGLLTTDETKEKGQEPCQWVTFTELGIQVAEKAGLGPLT